MSSQTIRLVKRRIVEVVIDSTIKGRFKNDKKPQFLEDPLFSEEEDSDVSSYAQSSVEDDEHDNVPSSSTLTPRNATPGAHYPCPYLSCGKSYTKPCRLAEHVRSHTGERPYKCNTCGKSYLRESHLQVHARIHLPESERPFPCTHDGCIKRFWAPQHRTYHISAVHNREKTFRCTEDNCEVAFLKHSQLKQHVAETHCPPGTKPYRCAVEHCTKSFPTNQRLRAHSKTHEDRYACTDTACRITDENGSSKALYFPTWSALQTHMRQKHPPSCPYDECNGRTFTRRTYLKNHLKLHEEKEVAKNLAQGVGTDLNVKGRRGGELGRNWSCKADGCSKAFKSKRALTVHHNITHLGRRDFVCTHPGCGDSFGYKHLLQRHEAKAHLATVTESEDDAPSSSSSDDDNDDDDDEHDIDWITGKEYTTCVAHNNTRRPLLHCPWPNRFNLTMPIDESIERCSYIFSRAYDLRRHLKAEHSFELTKNEVDSWVKSYRKLQPSWTRVS